MYSYDRSVVASQVKCMFWLLTTIYFPKDDLFPERICNVLLVIRFEDFERGFSSHMANIWERSAQNNPFYYPTALRRVQISRGICTPKDRLDRFPAVDQSVS